MPRIWQIKQTAMAAAQQAYGAATDGRNLIADIADGVLLKAKPLPGLAAFIAKGLISLVGIFMHLILGRVLPSRQEEMTIEAKIAQQLAWIDDLDEFPIALVPDLKYDNFPQRGVRYGLVGGPHDGKPWTCKKDRQKIITFDDGSTYMWDGFNPVHVPDEAETPE